MTEAKVLLVDDDLSLLQLEQGWFEAAGLRADIATSKEDAIDLMRERIYLVVVTDVVLAGIGSPELLTTFKRYSPLTQVVILAGNSSGAQAIDCLQRGAIDFFFKSDNLLPLIASVKVALDRAERWLNQFDCSEHVDESVLGIEMASRHAGCDPCDTVVM